MIPTPNQSLSIYTDGGARGNPGPGASAFVVYASGAKELFRQGIYLGPVTNNQAEYTAVLRAIRWLSGYIQAGHNVQQVNFYLDSLLVVNQIIGVFKVKDTKLKQIHNQIILIKKSLLPTLINFLFIPRAQNTVTDLLVNTTLDSSLM